MLKPFRVFTALLLFSFFLPAQETQAPAKPAPANPTPVPVEASRQANPVKTSPESIAAGKKWYGYDCAMCHGKDGDGKGSVASDMKLPMSDFTDPASLKDRTDGDLFYIIKTGRGQMPPEGDRLKPNELWNLVNYIRSLAKKKPAAEEKPAQ